MPKKLSPTGDARSSEEEDHVDWLEVQLDQIKQMGSQNYLVEQID